MRALVVAAVLAALTLAASPVSSAPLPPAPAAIAANGPAVADIAGAAVAPYVASAPRARVPEDRYAMAGGCYTLRSVTSGRYVARRASGPVAAAPTATKAERFRFQATDLGKYLLYATRGDFLATSEGAVGQTTNRARSTSVGAAAGGLSGERLDDAVVGVNRSPANTATGRGATVVLAGRPSWLGNWKVTQLAEGTFAFALPSVDKVLVADRKGALDLVAASEAGKAGAFRLERTRHCKVYPEVGVNVRGPVAGGDTPHSEVSGYIDAHLHAMAFEFLGGRARCGRPWHPFGAPFALRGCKEHEIAGGRAAVLENVLSNRSFVAGHDTNAGWPTFTDWPKYNSLTYEQVYYKWLERAWRGGLRGYVNLLVDNNQLCRIYPYKSHGCNEMEGVRRQYRRVHQLQDYIDAQSGGPGEGWFRIVDDPFEARRVMNSGRLAVILGIEVSVLFDCGVHLGRPACSAEQIDERLDEVYDMGVRQMELVNKFDNGLSGVTGDEAQTGVFVNSANFLETGQFWQMRTCKDEQTDAHDKHQHNFHDDSGAPEEFSGRDSLVGVLLSEFGSTGAAPVYGPGPHCSDVGLSALGEHLIRRMMEKGMVFDPDHMSAKARDQALDIIEAQGYSGVISSHSWADDTIYPRIWKTGGVVTPHAGTSESFVADWRQQKAWSDDRFVFGLGFGSDMNGFSTQGAPRGKNAPKPVRYPFTGFGGATVDQQVSGTKTYDYNVDGVAHYGMYADFVEDVRRLGGDEVVADMQRGAEAYLQMWERAAGVAASSCRPDVADLSSEQVARVQSGMSPEQVLLALGQPAARSDVFFYCADGSTMTVRFGPGGGVTGIEADAPQGVPDTAASGAGTAPAENTTGGGRERAKAQAAAGTQKATVDGAQARSQGRDHEAGDHQAADATPTSSRSRAAGSAGLLVVLVLALTMLIRRRPAR